MHTMRRQLRVGGRVFDVEIYAKDTPALDGVHVSVPRCYDGEHVHPFTWPRMSSGRPGFDPEQIADAEAARLQSLADAGQPLWS